MVLIMVSSCDCKDCELRYFVDGGIGTLAVVLLQVFFVCKWVVLSFKGKRQVPSGQ